MNVLQLKNDLHHFLCEDLGYGDRSIAAFEDPESRRTGYLKAKESGVFVGRQVIVEGYKLIDPSILVEMKVVDGERVAAGEVIAVVKGPLSALLAAERVLLNLVQRMSGIATLTTRAVRELEGGTTCITDTRKTTPGLRMYEKYAVQCGGGVNHRFNLHELIMLKENHITGAGGITEAVQRVKQNAGFTVKIEVETTNEEEMMEALEAGVDIIMFDNMEPEEVHALVPKVPESIVTEISGGMTIEQLRRYKMCGADYISMGSLTHSPSSLDISFLLKTTER
ncbi:carboxylating nicotinate-nucleotide diphosphorylase [Salsuginibacillus kocurii]|uniref:carboxylating nicotinate-nucleotide diphosphorylase n=1 Tax=Salsuginibacillus kocurii TaxID=427078 RepID=UPI000365F5E5|nr:carboxylating nicotinate-nucleotide diphosphorylase [Salsuginibacillus kocurii]